MEVRVFKWFNYVSLCPQEVANELHLYYILSLIFLDNYNILWSILFIYSTTNTIFLPMRFLNTVFLPLTLTTVLIFMPPFLFLKYLFSLKRSMYSENVAGKVVNNVLVFIHHINFQFQNALMDYRLEW